MPMFPLGLVLLPGGVLPLNVFEDRYLQMFREILADDVNPPEFGVALITKGRDAGGGDQRAMVATSARILDMQATPDGRYVLAAVGTDRLRINAWLPDDPYPVADVDVWTDADVRRASRAPKRRERVAARARTGRRAERPRRGARRRDTAARPTSATTHCSPSTTSVRWRRSGPSDRFRLLAAPGLDRTARGP